MCQIGVKPISCKYEDVYTSWGTVLTLVATVLLLKVAATWICQVT